MELKRLCDDANEIESGVEVDDNDAFVCELMDESVQSSCTEHRQVGHHHVLPIIGVQPSIQIKESHSFQDVDNPGDWSSYTFRPMFEPRGGK